MTNIEKLKKIKLFTENPDLALHQELVLNNELLEKVLYKLDEVAKKPSPEMPAFPEPKEPDFTETNRLLAEVLMELKKEKPKEDIQIDLQIT